MSKGACIVLLGSIAHFALAVPISPPLEVYLDFNNGNSQPAQISQVDAGGLTTPLPDAKGVVRVAMNELKMVRIQTSDQWEETKRAMKRGEISKALPTYRALALRVAPLLSLPRCDASRYFFAYTDLLRSLGRYSQVQEMLKQVPQDAPANVRARAIISNAFCLAMTQQIDEAERQLNLLTAPSRQSALFTIYQLTKAQLSFSRQNIIGALDELAQIIALKRLGSDGYAEALFLSAEAYDALGAAIARQKEEIAKNDKLRRQYEQDRDTVFAELNILKSDSTSVSAIMDDPPDLTGVSNTIRKQLVRIYPDSVWAAKAKQKLPRETPDNEKTPEKKSIASSKASSQTKQDSKNTMIMPQVSPTPKNTKISAEENSAEMDNL